MPSPVYSHRTSSPTTRSIQKAIELSKHYTSDTPTCFLDLKMLQLRYRQWRELLPSVQPFYAVKCNDTIPLLEELARLGCKFDCASIKEMDRVVGLKVTPDRIVYSHPIKMISHLKHSKELGIKLTVVDSVEEVSKIAIHHPEADILIRVACLDAATSRYPMSGKFGARLSECEEIIKQSMRLGVSLVGVHFHVGSGCLHASSYRKALEDAAEVFRISSEAGVTMRVLDIGGGFPSKETGLKISFPEIAKVLREGIAELFNGVKVIAEPGRFFAESSCHLLTKVIGVRRAGNHGTERASNSLPFTQIHSITHASISETSATGSSHGRIFINESMYNSLLEVAISKGTTFSPIVIERVREEALSSQPSAVHPESVTIFGCTCDGGDVLMDSTDPLICSLKEGDFILWPECGSYSNTCCSEFNGFPMAEYVVYSS